MLVIYIDGACQPNPGKMGVGGVIRQYNKHGKQTAEITFSINLGREGTNNIAEYTALLKALKIAELLSDTSISIKSDSELMVKQLTGQYSVTSERIKELHQKALKMLERYSTVSVEHIPRHQNIQADQLAKKYL